MTEFSHEIGTEEYLALRRSSGFTELPPEEAAEGLAHTCFCVCARENGRAIGFARLLWDRGYIAFLSDVIVEESYRGQGLGRALVERCIDALKSGMKKGWRVKIYLAAAQGKEGFYEKLGFSVRPNDHAGAGMDKWFVEGEEDT